uniref:Kinesin motor domain-containing protein n=1 Tax=Macrostomum lignano TaxID=282301 RepID=A0A1I8FN36_9PLAT
VLNRETPASASPAWSANLLTRNLTRASRQAPHRSGLSRGSGSITSAYYEARLAPAPALCWSSTPLEPRLGIALRQLRAPGCRSCGPPRQSPRPWLWWPTRADSDEAAVTQEEAAEFAKVARRRAVLGGQRPHRTECRPGIQGACRVGCWQSQSQQFGLRRRRQVLPGAANLLTRNLTRGLKASNAHHRVDFRVVNSDIDGSRSAPSTSAYYRGCAGVWLVFDGLERTASTACETLAARSLRPTAPEVQRPWALVGQQEATR